MQPAVSRIWTSGATIRKRPLTGLRHPFLTRSVCPCCRQSGCTSFVRVVVVSLLSVRFWLDSLQRNSSTRKLTLRVCPGPRLLGCCPPTLGTFRRPSSNGKVLNPHACRFAHAQLHHIFCCYILKRLLCTRRKTNTTFKRAGSCGESGSGLSNFSPENRNTRRGHIFQETKKFRMFRSVTFLDHETSKLNMINIAELTEKKRETVTSACTEKYRQTDLETNPSPNNGRSHFFAVVRRGGRLRVAQRFQAVCFASCATAMYPTTSQASHFCYAHS